MIVNKSPVQLNKEYLRKIFYYISYNQVTDVKIFCWVI